MVLLYVDIETLYASFPERDDQLRQLYNIGAETLDSDAGLEALAPGITEEDKAKFIPLVVSANELASEAWDRAQALVQAGTSSADPQVQRLRAFARTKYRELMNVGLLAETHVWYFNAARRVAMINNSVNEPDTELWDTVLRCGALVWPADCWMEARPLLRGALKAAMLEKDAELIEQYQHKLNLLEETLDIVSVSTSKE